MTRNWSFNLAFLFLLVFCICVGLSCVGEVNFQDLNAWECIAYLLWIVAETLYYGSATYVSIGLFEQVFLLKTALRKSSKPDFDTRFALLWRFIVGILLAVMVFAKVAIVQRLIVFPDLSATSRIWIATSSEHYLIEALIHVCLLVVTGDLIYQHNSPSKSWNRTSTAITWTLLVLFLTWILPRWGEINYLVYRAINGVEKGQPARFQRPEAYPDFASQGYWLFWISLVAVICAMIGTAVLMSLLDPRDRSKRDVILRALVGCGLCVFSASFAYWFYFDCAPRLFPDFAEGGIPFIGWQWFQAISFLFLLLPIAVYRLTVDPSRYVVIKSDQTNKGTWLRAHFLPIALTSAMILFAASFISFCFTQTGPPQFQLSLGDYVLAYLERSDSYLHIAILLTSMRLAWVQWRIPIDSEGLRIPVVNLRRCAWACILLVIVVVLNVPTFSAYSMLSWLGPW